MNKLTEFGLPDDMVPGPEELAGRIIKDFGRSWLVITEFGTFSAVISGKMRHKSSTGNPAIGDWVLMQPMENSGEHGSEGKRKQGIILDIHPRKSSISRNRAGSETAEQILAANIDIVFIVFSLEGGRQFSQGAVERYITMGWNSGALPVVILNKTDLVSSEELTSAMKLAEEAAPGVDIFLTSCNTKEGLDQLIPQIGTGRTCVVLGPSGVGKSSIINALAGGEHMKTGGIREKEKKGSHTTTHRELILLPEGGCMIDTPGLRELQLWADDEALEKTFADIEEIAKDCHFRDCSHQGEPACAVQAALAEGILSHRRFENFLDLQRELAYVKRKTDQRAQKEETDKWKQIHMSMRRFNKNNGR